MVYNPQKYTKCYQYLYMLNERVTLQIDYIIYRKRMFGDLKPMDATERMYNSENLQILKYWYFYFSCLGSALRCYKCSDYTGRCENVQECTYEDSCLSLSERGGLSVLNMAWINWPCVKLKTTFMQPSVQLDCMSFECDY